MSFCTIRSVVVHYPVWGCAGFSTDPRDAPYINSRGNLVVTLNSIPKNGDGSLPATLCYNRDIAGGFVPRYVGCAKVINVQGGKVELKGHSTLLNTIKGTGIAKGCMCAPAPNPAWAPPAGVVQSSYGPYPQGSPSASFSAAITSSYIPQIHPSSGTWHYFDEYYCKDLQNLNVGIKDLACRPSKFRSALYPRRRVAIHETYLPIGGGNVCTIDPGNTFHFAIRINQKKVNYHEVNNCCIGCCAFCVCGQNGLGINELPWPWFNQNNCDNCYEAVRVYFSSMKLEMEAMGVSDYTVPNICWASKVNCDNLRHPSSSWGCNSSSGGYSV
jgi:hypothetical protein